jgi:hypothetical protein
MFAFVLQCFAHLLRLKGALKLQNTGWIQQCGVAWVVEDGGRGEDDNMG